MNLDILPKLLQPAAIACRLLIFDITVENRPKTGFGFMVGLLVIRILEMAGCLTMAPFYGFHRQE